MSESARFQVDAAAESAPLLSFRAGCREGESSCGEASVDELAAVLDLAEGSAKDAQQMVGVGESDVVLARAACQRPNALDGVQVGRIGGQLDRGNSAVRVDVGAQMGVQVHVQVVPDPPVDEGTIAIGDYGRYSAIRDWNLGDVDRRDLRPAPDEELSGVGQWMHEMARRDGEFGLAEGIAHLFGKAECPRCASVFTVSGEYEEVNCPVLR